MNLLPLIEKKREGRALSVDEIQSAVAAFTRGEIPDYQMSSFLMAVFFRGLDATETRALTFAMRDSGDVLQFPSDPRPVVDKHSTGGIGDKVSLPLAPLLACLGFRVPMISGRGLGITGGTLDKLESIPGYRTRPTAEEIIRQIQEVGCVICGQTTTMCPADRLMYALRDASGTVPSIPLITASILSKKLAEGIGALVLDVKFGSAAFMQTREQARALALSMTAIANESGVQTRSVLTDMNSPLGRTAGNWLEVKESVECLEGRGPEDLQQLVIECAAHLLVQNQRAAGLDTARAQAQACLASGEPRRRWDELLAAQGADLAAFQRKLALDHTAPVVRELKAAYSGYVSRCDARLIGEVVRDLGGGRLTKDTVINPDVGVDALAKPGERREAGSTLCRAHAPSETAAAEALARLANAFELSTEPPATTALVHEVI